MKKFILTGLLLLSSNVYALDINTCNSTKEYAESTIEARQVGVPLQKVLDQVAHHKDTNPETWLVLSAIISRAYFEPIYKESIKDLEIREFALEVKLVCLQNDTLLGFGEALVNYNMKKLGL